MQRVTFYLILLFVLFGLSLAASLFIVFLLPPGKTVNLILFYVAIAITIFALATLVGFYLRKLFGQRELLNHYIATAARQGLWLGLILVVSMILLHQNLFNWINAIFLVLTFVFLEFFILNRNNNQYGPTQ